MCSIIYNKKIIPKQVRGLKQALEAVVLHLNKIRLTESPPVSPRGEHEAQVKFERKFSLHIQNLNRKLHLEQNGGEGRGLSLEKHNPTPVEKAVVTEKSELKKTNDLNLPVTPKMARVCLRLLSYCFCESNIY